MLYHLLLLVGFTVQLDCINGTVTRLFVFEPTCVGCFISRVCRDITGIAFGRSILCLSKPECQIEFRVI